MKILCALVLSLLVMSCRSCPCPPGDRAEAPFSEDGTVHATTWIGFEYAEPNVYDRLPKAEKHALRARLWAELGSVGLSCPEPLALQRITLTEDPVLGVTNAELIRKLDVALGSLRTGLTAYAPQRVQYECVSGRMKCKHPFLLHRSGALFESTLDTSLGPIHATYDVTVVWDSH